MPNIGPMEIAIVLIIALIVFGPKRLPELGKSLGKGIQEFKGTIGGDKSDSDEHGEIEPAPVVVTPAAAAPKAPATTPEQHA
jgi:sec-independent protein translocase protein TatA